jgi:hypothetical protein
MLCKRWSLHYNVVQEVICLCCLFKGYYFIMCVLVRVSTSSDLDCHPMNIFPARWEPLIPGETCHGSSRKLTMKCHIPTKLLLIQELQSPFSGSIATIERMVNVNKPLHYVQFASIAYKVTDATIAVSFFSCFTNATNLCALYFFGYFKS